VLSAFQWDASVDQMIVRPVGLRPSSTYEIQSVDIGDLGTATGGELMADGIMLLESPESAAHILVLKRR
jgi:hypothetical protein